MRIRLKRLVADGAIEKPPSPFDIERPPLSVSTGHIPAASGSAMKRPALLPGRHKPPCVIRCDNSK